MKLGLTLLLLLCQMSLGALLSEYSASANALSGITMLSESVADLAISPLVASSGFAASYHRPFGLKDTTFYGLHTAQPLGIVNIGTGINYLAHPDYRWQDQYLVLGIHRAGFALGATQHLLYERIASTSSYTWDNDLALGYLRGNYGAEIRWLRCREPDAAVVLSVQTRLSTAASVCIAYTYRKHASDSYGLASSYQIASPLLLQTSWQSDPARFGLGCKFSIDSWYLMYSLRTHPELNLTHSLDIGRSW